MSRVVMLTGGSPWGLTLSGGKDFGSHLQILKVSPGGKAMKSGIKEKEYILAINNEDAEGMTHHEAQQKIRFTGQTLSLKLTNEKPTRGAASVPTTTTATTTKPDSSPPTTNRPKAPPVPTPQTPPAARPTAPPTTRPTPPPTTTTTKSTTPSKPQAQVPVHQRPVVKKSAVSEEPVASASTIVPESGLYSGQQSTLQSPAFKKITIESPSVLSPKSTYTPPPPTEPMKNVTIDDGNVRKTSQRPQPPPNNPTQFTTTTMKLQSNTGPRAPPPVSRPAPPPTAKQHPPPPSPSSSTTPQSPVSKVVSRQGICEACKQPIRGAYASAMNKTWHPEHFVCYSCQKSLSNTSFVYEDDKIFCSNCYENQVAETCFKCRRPIVGPIVSAANNHYHRACFTCAKCFADLTAQDGFNMEANELYCKDCFGGEFGAICIACNNTIAGNELWVEALNHTWHPQCFVCEGCRCPLDGARFYSKYDRPYCGQCC